MAAGASICSYGLTTGPAAGVTELAGAAVFAVGSVNYMVGPTGSGLTSVGNYIVNDPPDPHFTFYAVPDRVGDATLPKGSPPLLRDAVSFVHASKVARAYLAALATTINRVGGAKVAHNRVWEGRQQRYAFMLARAGAAALHQVQRGEARLARDYAAFARTFRPLTSAQLAVAKRVRSITPRQRALLAGLGITPSALLSATHRAVPGAALPTALPINPLFRSQVSFGISMLLTYPKIPEVQTLAKL